MSEKQRRSDMSWITKVLDFFKPLSTTELVRTRNKKGQFVGDDKSTSDVNEAYTRVKKRGRPRKKK